MRMRKITMARQIQRNSTMILTVQLSIDSQDLEEVKEFNVWDQCYVRIIHWRENQKKANTRIMMNVQKFNHPTKLDETYTV